MQTGESLYALALAGLGPDHPAMRRGIVALLGRQQAFGGWFDVNPYEQFRTPFRETQWALIALSSLYPNPKPRPHGWNGPLGPQPATLRTDSPGDLDPRPRADLGRARRRARSGRWSPSLATNRRWCDSRPAGRSGRVGDEAAIAGLARCLGDETQGRAPGRGRGVAADRQPAQRLAPAGRDRRPRLRLVAELAQALALAR